MPPLDSEELFDLTRKEKRVYQFKEALQKRMLFFFGIAAGLSVIFDSAYNYYYLYSVRLSMPKYADTMHFDLEYDAIVSIFAGVVITLTPIFISHLLSERPAEDYATIRYEKYSIGTHLLGLISIHVALLILAFGAYIALVSYSFESSSGQALCVWPAVLSSPAAHP